MATITQKYVDKSEFEEIIMKKNIAIVLCLVLVLLIVGCGNKMNLDGKPTITGIVIDWWGTSVTIEVTESSIDTIQEGSMIFFEQDDMDNFRDWIDLSIDDQVQIIFDGESILTGGSPISLEKVYKVSKLSSN